MNLSGLPQKDSRNTVEYKAQKQDEVKLHRLTRSYLQDNVFFYGTVEGLCLSSTRLPMQINFSKKNEINIFLKKERKENNARLQCFNPVGGKQSCNSAGYVCAHLQARQVWREGRSTEFQFLLFRE